MGIYGIMAYTCSYRYKCELLCGRILAVIIVGIDPGYATVGWGVVEHAYGKFACIGYGAITTPPTDDFPSRLLQIYRDVGELFDKAKPDALAVEQLFFTNNKTTGIGVAQARGVILLAAAERGLALSEYTPPQVKQGVTGYGAARKEQVMDMTRRLLNLPKPPKPDDAADALAVAICHAHAGGSALSRYV